MFAETGYRAGKVSTVAARLGVSEPVIFQNFGSKAGLFAAVLERTTNELCDELPAAAERFGSVSGLLTAMLEPDHIERLHAPGSLGVLFADAAALTTEPGIEDTAQHCLQRFACTLADLLRRGQDAGDIRADLDPRAGAWWVMSMVSARTFRAAVMPDRAALEAQLAAMTVESLSAENKLS